MLKQVSCRHFKARLPRHPNATSLDGSKVAVGGIGKGVSVFDAATGKQLFRLLKDSQPAVIGFSNDGQTLLIVHRGRIVSWLDLKTGRELSRYPEAPNGGAELPIFQRSGLNAQRFHAPCAAASADGRLAAVGDQDKLICIGVDDAGRARLLFESSVDSIACLAFSADSKQLATAGDDALVLIWDVASGKPVRQLDTHGKQVASLAFSPDGKCWRRAHFKERFLLDAATGKQIKKPGHRGAIGSSIQPRWQAACHRGQDRCHRG